MNRYFCDRCKKEIPAGQHEKVEINRRRFDVCQSGDCKQKFAAMKILAGRMTSEASKSLQEGLANLEIEFFNKVEDGDTAEKQEKA